MKKFIVGFLMLAFMPFVSSIAFLCPIIGACFFYGWDASDKIIMNWDKKTAKPGDAK